MRLRQRALPALVAAILLLLAASLPGGCKGSHEVSSRRDTETQPPGSGEVETVAARTNGDSPRTGTDPDEISSYAEAEVDIETEVERADETTGEHEIASETVPDNGDGGAGADSEMQTTPSIDNNVADFSIYFSFVSPNPVISGRQLEADVVISGSASSVAVELRHEGQTLHEYPLSLRHQGHGQETWAWAGSAPEAIDGGYKIYISASDNEGESEVQFHGNLQVVAPSVQ